MRKVSKLSFIVLIPFIGFLLLGIADINHSRGADRINKAPIELDFKADNSVKKEQNVEIICEPTKREDKKWHKKFRLSKKNFQKILVPRNYNRCRIIKKGE